jgi:hypothetical protein
MQMNYPLQAPSALLPGKGPTFPTGEEAINILNGVIIGAFVHPQVSK